MSTISIKIFTEVDGGTEEIVKVPAIWEICPVCEGCATDRGASVECDGGGFTASEWHEQDDDFKQDYLKGVYDQPCAPCKGLGRVLVPDRDRIEADVLELLDKAEQDAADFRSLCAAERRMGA